MQYGAAKYRAAGFRSFSAAANTVRGQAGTGDGQRANARCNSAKKRRMDNPPLQPVKEGGVLLRRSAFFFCMSKGKEEKAEKNREGKSAAMSARRAF